MTFEKLSSLVMRLFFAAAFVLLALAVCEAIVNVAGYTILQGSWQPGRLLDYAVVLLVFVLALLLRQIRDRVGST